MHQILGSIFSTLKAIVDDINSAFQTALDLDSASRISTDEISHADRASDRHFVVLRDEQSGDKFKLFNT